MSSMPSLIAADAVQLVGPNRSVELFGLRLVGVNAETGTKLLFSIVFVPAVVLSAKGLTALTGWLTRGHEGKRVRFWARQVVRLVTTVVLLLGLASIWF